MLFSGLPNKAIDVMSSMGITCSSKTARELIKVAGLDCDRMVRRVLHHQDEMASKKVSKQDLTRLIQEMSTDPYLYFGQNAMPHKFVLNGKTICITYLEK